MALVGKERKVYKTQEPIQRERKPLSLNQYEIEVLLNSIKQSTFKGADLEKIYNLVYKLQEEYVYLENNK